MNGKKSNNGNYLYEFGAFRVDASQGLFLRDDQPVRVPPKTFELLLFLLERNNQVVDKESIMAAVWQNTFVEDSNLTVHISTLRKIFDSDKTGSARIETFPKHGYRLTAKVTENGHSIEPIPQDAAESSSKLLLFDEIPATSEQTVHDTKDPALAKALPKFVANNRNSFVTAFLIVIPVIVASGFFLNWFGRSSLSFKKLTRIQGTEKTVQAAISPHGEYLAHVVTSGAKQSLHVIHIATKSSDDLVPPEDVEYSGLTFSNDGNFIYYVPKEKNSSVLYRIPILGGERKRVLANVASAIGFSPDGTRFAFVRETSNGESSLMIANTDGSGERNLATRRSPEFFSTAGLSWSPDGSSIACPFGIQQKDRKMQVAIYDSETGREKLIFDKKWNGIDRVAWLSDGRGVVAPAFETGSAKTQIWIMPYPSGEPFQVTNDLENYGDLSLTADSKTLVSVQFTQHSAVWLKSNNDNEIPKAITSGKHHEFKFVSWTPDNRILFGSNEGENRDVWIMNSDGSDQRQLTSNARENSQPVMTNDGRTIFFTSDRVATGTYNIWKMNSDGSDQVQVTFGMGEIHPIVTPNGKWIVYTAGGMETGDDKRSIWKIPIGGGEPIPIVAAPSHWPDVSPDGKSVGCWYKPSDESPWKVAIFSIDGGSPIKIFDVTPNSPVKWTPEGNAIS